MTPETFRTELAPARTFLFEEEAKWLRAQGLGLRACYEDLLVFGQSGPIHNELRFEDECVRHKALDLVGDLSLAGFDLTLKWNDRKTVHLSWIRVAGILAESGLTGRPEQKLSIKLEIDTRPPAGAVSLTEIVTRHIMFSVRHHDLPSLMARKIHALCTRGYSKGRDWYDLLWYRTQRPPVEPNLIMLQNALDQTEGLGAVDGSRWTRHLLQRIGTLDTSRLASDVRPFLERPADADLLAARNFRSVLEE